MVFEEDMIYQKTYTNLLDGKGKGVASLQFNSKLLMDVVTVGHLDICINEAGCLKMKNLVYFNEIRYTLNNQDMFQTIIFIITARKEGG